LISPVGQITDPPVQPPLQKYSRSLLTQITCISLAIPAQHRGAFRDRHERKVGMRWTRVARLTSAPTCGTVKSCGPDASMVGVKFLGSKLLGDDGDNRARSPGRDEGNRNTIACGNAGCPGATVVTNACAFYYCARGCGCNGHPAFPTPFVGRIPRQDSGASCRENTEVYLKSEASFRGDAKHRTRNLEIPGLRFAHPGMTAFGLLRFARNDGSLAPRCKNILRTTA
jgi:hypothetical protein